MLLLHLLYSTHLHVFASILITLVSFSSPQLAFFMLQVIITEVLDILNLSCPSLPSSFSRTSISTSTIHKSSSQSFVDILYMPIFQLIRLYKPLQISFYSFTLFFLSLLLFFADE
jgi:hypothetical protein